MERHDLDKLFKMIVVFLQDSRFHLNTPMSQYMCYKRKGIQQIHRNDRKNISEICKLFYNYLFNLLTDKVI